MSNAADWRMTALDARRGLRIALACTLGLGVAALAALLATVDVDIGAPRGADRLVRTADALDAAAAADAARAALHVRPVDGPAYRILAGIAAREGWQVRADALYAQAVRRDPHDVAARVALLDHAFARGELVSGCAQLDALLRVAPSAAQPLLRALAPYYGDGPLQEALVPRLASAPWRGTLASVLRDPALAPADSLGLLRRLSQVASLTPQESEVRAILLQRLGRDAEARAGWLAGLPPAMRAASATVTDGGFEHPDLQGAFAWQLAPPPGVTLDEDTVDPAEGLRALAINFGGRAVVGPGLSQALALPPGRYRFRAESDNRTDAMRPFAWRLHCAAASEPLLDLALPARPGWQVGGAFFAVPPECPAQLLRLEYLGRSLSERQIAGTLRVDALRITSASAP